MALSISGVNCGGTRGNATSCDQCICYEQGEMDGIPLLSCGSRGDCGGDCQWKSSGGSSGMCARKQGTQIVFILGMESICVYVCLVLTFVTYFTDIFLVFTFSAEGSTTEDTESVTTEPGPESTTTNTSEPTTVSTLQGDMRYIYCRIRLHNLHLSAY